MRKIIGFYSGPYDGTDANCAFLVPKEYTDDQIIDWIADWAWTGFQFTGCQLVPSSVSKNTMAQKASYMNLAMNG